MIITISKIKCQTQIGFLNVEQGNKQLVTVDVKIDYDEGKSPITDNYEDTLNYHPIVERITEYVEGNKFNLVEKVVHDVGKIVLEYDRVLSTEITVSKPEAPVENIENFSVTKKFNRSANWFPII